MARYIFDSHKFSANIREFKEIIGNGFPLTIGYSVKTNYIPAVCALAFEAGCLPEIVSPMEHHLVTEILKRSEKIIYNGPIKDVPSLKQVVQNGGYIQVDNVDEYHLIRDLQLENANIILRLNASGFRNSTSRFGEPIAVWRSVIKQNPLNIIGIHVHLPNRCAESFEFRVKFLSQAIDELKDLINIKLVNIGGGFIGHISNVLRTQFNYPIPTLKDYHRILTPLFTKIQLELPNAMIFCEPGSSLVADCMDLEIKITSKKVVGDKIIYSCDGSSHNFKIQNVNFNPEIQLPPQRDNEVFKSLIVGYTCIEGDVLFKGDLPLLQKGDKILIKNIGSYSIVMKPPFIMPDISVVDKHTQRILKKAQKFNMVFSDYEVLL